MGDFIKLTGLLFVAMIVILFLYNLLKLYVFKNFKPFKGLKWIMVGATVLCVFGDSFLQTKFGFWSWQYLVGMAVFMLCLVSSFDLFGWGKSKYAKNSKNGSDKDIVIKPKAKPNRAKKKSNE